MKKIICILSTLLLSTALTVTGCSKAPTTPDSSTLDASIPDTPLKGETITIGCSSTFVPFESISMDPKGNKTFVGMNIEIIETMADKYGFTVEFQDMPFKSLIGAIQAGRIDMCIGGMRPTEERKESLDFSEIYFYPRNAIVYQAGNSYPDLTSLEGKTVAYAFGTNYQQVAESIKDVKGIGIQGSPACIEEVKTGRADACIIDGAGASEFLKVNDKLAMSLLDKTEDCFAIGFPKESPYYETINSELINMMENGELDAIITKYLSEEFILD
ncbi:MAG: ABC transporter substrate-binding protein [Cellulosilyticaceae bacterium]